MAAPMSIFAFAFCLSVPGFIFSLKMDGFTTKTAYDWVFNHEESKPKVNEFMEMKFEGRSCRAVHVSVLVRHGARQPGWKDMKKITKIHSKIVAALTNEDYSFLRDWTNEFNEKDEKFLIERGRDEQYELGARMGERFQELFDDNLRKIKFVSSSKQRCLESAKSFHEGITEYLVENAFPKFYPFINDKILRFHEKCHRFIRDVEEDKSHLEEYERFKESPYMKSISEAFSKRLGLENVYLSSGELKVIFFMCAFEMLMFNRDDWCRLLTDSDREVLEYHSDMKQYWKKGYGHPVIREMTCPLASAMFNTMDKIILHSMNSPGRRSDVGTFYFGHAETIAPFYAALGLFKDHQPLLSDNFIEMKNRTFKTSQILPFSANLAIALYDCHDRLKNDEIQFQDFAVRMFVNEKPVRVPTCGDTICWYPDVRNNYASLIDKCDFDKICEAQKDEL